MDPIAEFKRRELMPVGRPFVADHETRWRHRAYRFLDTDSPLLSIGSCLSANLLRWLALHKLNTAPAPWGLHYNPMTVLRELRIISGDELSDITWEARCRDGDTRYVDAFRHPIVADSREALDAVRARIRREGQLAFRQSAAFFFLFGLSEVWEERDEKGQWHVINRSPPFSVFDATRHRNRNLSVHEIQQAVESIVALIRTRRGVQVPLVLAIDPIALKVSSNGSDPRVANHRSKAALSAALLDYLDRADKYTYYFPAFELLNGGPRPRAFWQRDGRHPDTPGVIAVGREFVRAFAIDQHVLSQELSFEVRQA